MTDEMKVAQEQVRVTQADHVWPLRAADGRTFAENKNDT